MTPGQLFELPSNVYLVPGHIGLVKDNTGEPSAKYEVVLIDGQLKARIMVTYRNKRRKDASPDHGR